MKKTVHVHIHEQTAPTRDADSGEGRWVTIHGAHVHIGEGGKIDKGPAALVGKSEHEAHADSHAQKSREHVEAAQSKGVGHPDGRHHRAASREHSNAAIGFRNAHMAAERGDIAQARKDHQNATVSAAGAAGHEKKIGAGKEPEDAKSGNPFDMPASHEALHERAAADVKSSEKHKAEHNRLLNLYHSSKQNWERSAVNRLIEKNAVSAAQHRVEGLHQTAKAASELAHRTGTASDHAIALQHINNAIDAHGKVGGVGYAVKQDELRKLAKGHDDAVTKANNAYMEQRRSGKGHEEAEAATGGKPSVDHDQHLSTHDVKKAEADVKARRADLEAKGFKHERSEGGREQMGGIKHHYGHEDGSRAVVIHQHHTGHESRHVVSSTVNTMNQGKKKGLDAIAARKAKKADDGGVSPMKKLAQTDAAAHHRAEAKAHRNPVGELAKPDHKMADLHDEKAAHHEAAAKGEDRSAQIKDVAARIAQHQSDALNKPKK